MPFIMLLIVVATRFETSIGLASHPDFLANAPEVLWEGFKAAGWTCFGASCVSMLIAVTRLRNLGIVGERSLDIKIGSLKEDVEQSPTPETKPEGLEKEILGSNARAAVIGT
ncbi:hypothetical protein C8J56DRAFT_897525 [Mycena floridula]|nr:hypothetical protein C8J56DRAFT_897525 [Mycena floridula]